ncbi:hypothetical protein [Streptomyces sp. 039-1]|uniref:hypothetical protein n=1 Tax=Streptomyces sp. 039-1 TaxID=2789263 RepID=UPI0039F6303D
MNVSRILTRVAPALALGAVMTAAMTVPAHADSGWWFSTNDGASGYVKAYGDKVTACDIKSDGYKALVQIASVNDSLLHRVADSYNDGKCTSRGASSFDLWEGSRYKIQVCVAKTGGSPKYCSALHEFTA